MNMAGPPARLQLPFDHWPETDRVLWTRATANDDPFGDAAGAGLAKTTLHSRWMAWRRFVGFHSATDPEALQVIPAKRITPDRLRKYARHLAETNTPYSVACQIDSFYGAARILLPKQDWTWLRQMRKRLFAAAPPVRRGPVITSMQLHDLGFALMTESGLTPHRPATLKAALQYRDGLIIALWAYIPVRHKNFAAIEIGRDFVKEDSKWCIIIPPEDSKTRVPIDFEIPDDLEGQLETYLQLVRPRLLRLPSCKALWISAKGGPLSYSALGPVVTRHTNERLGIRVTPHDARDAAATLWAIMAPDQIGVARDLLAHERLSTTNKYYNRARGIEASRRQARLIAKMRRR
jgi:integrase/recombinase XerD